MAQGISEILTFAIGVAISPVPIIAVILMNGLRAPELYSHVMSVAVLDGNHASSPFADARSSVRVQLYFVGRPPSCCG